MAKITPEIKRKYIEEAIGILGFEEREQLEGFFVKKIDDTTNIVVDLTEGKQSVYFNINKKKVIIDDAENTLAKVSTVIGNAETGLMPDQPEAPEITDDQETPKPVESYPNKKQETPPDKPKPKPKTKPAPEQDTEPAGQQKSESNDHIETSPAELVHSTAAPPPIAYQPQGAMILDIEPGLAETGAIKIGGKGEERTSQKSGQSYRLPVKYDHFVIQTKLKDDEGNFIIDPIMKKWGFSGTVEDGPIELDIYLLYDNPTSNFLTSYRQYKGGKCLCSGNGIDAVRLDGTKIKCNTETCTVFKSKQCKPNGILSVILKDAPTLGGVYKFRTTSFNSIRQILSSMFFIQSTTGGHLANIPLKMTLTPKIVNPINSPSAQTIFIVNIIFPGNIDALHEKTLDLVKERASMRKEILEIEAQARLAICAPETPDDIRDIEAEFYPEKE